MPVTREPGPSKLPAIASIRELADYERVDPRTLRRDLERGAVPGAFKRGNTWRVNTDIYMAAMARGRRENEANSA